jgi:glucose-6-phosphate 1-dehydrogenase
MQGMQDFAGGRVPAAAEARQGRMSMTHACTAIVILGASGNLTKRKLMPALHALYRRGELRECSVIVGEGRTPFTDGEFRGQFGITGGFSDLLVYHQGIVGLKKVLAGRGCFSRVIFFMALPPQVYAQTAQALLREGFGGESCIIIEKPFGENVESAKRLNRELVGYFSESQIYRNDHYLAKESVQNILVFRFANSLFSTVYNSRCIESIQINAVEEAGVGDRAQYFDGAGIIRDMVQNHLMQLLCLVAMEAPQSLDAEDIRKRKVEVLQSLSVKEYRRFQYEGYRGEKGVRPDSTTETFAELALAIDNDRWRGMPVYIRAGKALHRTGTEIGIRFKPPAETLFNGLKANSIVFKIQPSAGIVIGLSGKLPGNDIRLTDTAMTFCYSDAFDQEIPEAYQRLLLDAVRGDRTLFVGARETELSWQVLDETLDAGECGTYRPGTMPETGLGVEWIDFDSYTPVCSRGE